MTLYAKLVRPDSGYKSDIERVRTLDMNHFFIVKHVDMGQSSTRIMLENDIWYNSIHFDFFIEDLSNNNKMVLHDLYSDPEYNPYIR